MQVFTLLVAIVASFFNNDFSNATSLTVIKQYAISHVAAFYAAFTASSSTVESLPDQFDLNDTLGCPFLNNHSLRPIEHSYTMIMVNARPVPPAPSRMTGVDDKAPDFRYFPIPTSLLDGFGAIACIFIQCLTTIVSHVVLVIVSQSILPVYILCFLLMCIESSNGDRHVQRAMPTPEMALDHGESIFESRLRDLHYRYTELRRQFQLGLKNTEILCRNLVEERNAKAGLKKEFDQKAAENTLLRSRISLGENKVASLTEELFAAHEVKNASNSAKNEQIRILNHDSDEKHREIDSLSRQVKGLLNDRESLTDDLKLSFSSKFGLSKKLDWVNVESRTLRSENNDIKAELEVVKEELNRVRALSATLQQESGQLRDDMKSAREENDKLQLDLEERRSFMSKAEAALDPALQEAALDTARLQPGVDMNDVKVIRLATELEAVQSSDTTEIYTLHARISDLDRVILNKDERIESLTSQLHSRDETVFGLHEELESTRSRRDSELKSVRAQAKEWQQEVETKDIAVALLTAGLEHKDAELSMLAVSHAARIAELKEDNKIRLASLEVTQSTELKVLAQKKDREIADREKVYILAVATKISELTAKEDELRNTMAHSSSRSRREIVRAIKQINMENEAEVTIVKDADVEDTETEQVVESLQEEMNYVTPAKSTLTISKQVLVEKDDASSECPVDIPTKNSEQPVEETLLSRRATPTRRKASTSRIPEPKSSPGVSRRKKTSPDRRPEFKDLPKFVRDALVSPPETCALETAPSALPTAAIVQPTAPQARRKAQPSALGIGSKGKSGGSVSKTLRWRA